MTASVNSPGAPEAIEFVLPGSGTRIAALAFGPPDGSPVLALHGWLDNAASFLPLAPLLAGCRVVAIDLPGHGRSDHRSRDAGYHFVDWIPDVVGVADFLEWPRFALVGHSMGAAISSLTAGTYPERISALVLLDGLAPMVTEPGGIPKSLRRFIDQQRRLQQKRASPYPDRETMVKRLCQLVGDLNKRSAELLVERGSVLDAAGFRWSSDPRLRRTSSMRFSRAHVVAFLQAIEAPALFVRPDDGIAVAPELIEAALEAIGDVRVHRLSGQHHVHMDRAEELAPLIAEFILRHAPS